MIGFALFCGLAMPLVGTLAASGPNATSPCPLQAGIPTGHVVTSSSAYACRGELQSFPNVTSGVCVDAQNFTTARGYRTGSVPEGVECTFNFYAAPACKGYFVSAGRDTDGSNNWVECMRNFVLPNGDAATTGMSFMYACYGRYA